MTTPSSGIGSSTPTTGTTTPANSTGDLGAGMGKDTFLKLLVAQLKYQNPLSPGDSQQYMAQMAQFTQVEKLADIQKSQTDLLSWQRTVAGQGMIGKQITATPSGSSSPVSGTVTGLQLTGAGPRLVLSNGTTVAVDEVTAVDSAPSSPTAPTTASKAPTSSGNTTTPATGAATGSTPPTTPVATPATTPATAPTAPAATPATSTPPATTT